jgi:hypothetical protein
MSLNQSAKQLLTQLDQVIDQLEIANFSKSLPVLSHSSIGQHIRHTLEFYLCLMDGMNDESINYDERKRDTLIEQDPKVARRVIHVIKEFLSKNTTNRKLMLVAGYSVDDDEEVVMESNFYREIAYNIEHTIHHMALVKIGIHALNTSVVLPKHFGVASSTVRYKMSEKA